MTGVQTCSSDLGERHTLYTSPKGTTYGGGIMAPDGSAVAYSGGNDATQETSAVIVELDGSGVKILPNVDLSRGAWQPIAVP